MEYIAWRTWQNDAPPVYPRGKGTRPRALTAEALPPPYGIAYDARPPTVDLISSSSSLSFRLCLSLSDVFAHVPVTVT